MKRPRQYIPSTPAEVEAAWVAVLEALAKERDKGARPSDDDLPEAPALADLDDEDDVTAHL
jgi:hypothetical protein